MSTTGNRVIYDVPNEIWDAIFQTMAKKELLDLSVTCKSFQESAQKALLTHVTVTLTAATEGNIKALCRFMNTIFTVPRLAASVKVLDVAFVSNLKRSIKPQWTIDLPRPAEDFYQETSAPDIIAPYWSVFGPRLQQLAPVFESHGERRYPIIYNMLLALMLSGLPELQALIVDYNGFNPRSGPRVINVYTLPDSSRKASNNYNTSQFAISRANTKFRT